MLLVLGAAMLAGGVRYSEQHFNPVGARSEATMLTLAAIALIVPAAFEGAAGMTAEGLGRLSVSLSVVLLLTYVLFLTFALVTHPALFAGSAAKEEKAPASGAWSMLVLITATVGIAWMSEIMVGAIEPTTREFGFSSLQTHRWRETDSNHRSLIEEHPIRLLQNSPRDRQTLLLAARKALGPVVLAVNLAGK